MNVKIRGDVCQLPPPNGGFLGDIPEEFIRNARKIIEMPCVAHGQALLWSDDEDIGIHGVTELTECERTTDERLRNVQDEFRCGQLTDETNKF